MKTKHFTLIALILCGLSFSLSASDKEFKESKKNIEKSFTVEKDALVKIDNSFGDIIITTGNSNKVVFEVELVGKARDIENAEKRLALISVDIRQNKSENKITAETEIEELNLINDNGGIEITYTVTVPSSAVLDLRTKFGSIRIPTITTDLKAKVEYGNFIAKDLKGDNNEIEVKFGNFDVENVKNADLEIEFGNTTLKKAEKLNINSGFGVVDIEEVGTLYLDSQYDKYKIGRCRVITGDGGFTNYQFKHVEREITLSNSYGTIEVKKMGKDFDYVDIDNGFADVNITLEGNPDFDLNLENRHGEIRVDKRFHIESSDNKTKRYQEHIRGTVGNNPKARIKIETQYGTIRLN